MAQHFLLSAAARTLSLRQIYKAGEDAAYATFCTLRWPETDGEAVCPDCGCFEVYKITTRCTFKCKGCYRQFSVTSGTIFASRKLSFCDLLAAVCLFVNSFKGHIRPANHRKGRVDRRRKRYQTGTRRVVVVARARKGRTLTFVTRNEADGVDLVARNVTSGSVIYADEASHWDHLSRGYAMGRINHEESYSDLCDTYQRR